MENVFTFQIDNRDPFRRLLVTDNPKPVFSLRLLEGAPRLKGVSVRVMGREVGENGAGKCGQAANSAADIGSAKCGQAANSAADIGSAKCGQAANGSTIWESGLTPSLWITYDGPELCPKTTYCACVTIFFADEGKDKGNTGNETKATADNMSKHGADPIARLAADSTGGLWLNSADKFGSDTANELGSHIVNGLKPDNTGNLKPNIVDGLATSPSATLCATFETGFLCSPWQAHFIEPDQLPQIKEKKLKFHELFMPGADDGKVASRLRPAMQLKRPFHCGAMPDKARLYATAHGLYEVYINGTRLGENLLAPETSAYEKRLYYQSYDPLPHVKLGENTLEVWLADGWWLGRIGISGDNCQFGDKLGFLMQLELRFPDGQTTTICSDPQFMARASHIRYADLFVGERHDYAREPGPWAPCHEATYGMVNLYAQPIAPVVAQKELQPTFFTSPKGELIADFGEVIAGVADLETDAAKGTEITLDFCEILDPNGNYYQNIIGRNKNQQDSVACGNGATRFRPRFTYHGFRYVRVTGIAQSQILSLKAIVFGTELEQSGTFSCSNQDINQLQANICRSMRGNMLSVPTDCPQREKMGWTGDILAFANTAASNCDIEGFLRGWLANLRLEQREDGEVPSIVPCFPAQDEMDRERTGYNSSPAWGDACVLVPLYLYRHYGDIGILAENLDTMRRWLHFLADIAAKQPENYGFGDWLIPSLRGQGHSGVMAGVAATCQMAGRCFYAVTIRAFLEVLGELKKSGRPGLDGEIAQFAALLPRIRQAVQETYIDADGKIAGDLQGLYVLALYADIGGRALREKMAAHLVRLIRANGNRLDTGFASVPYLLDVLAETGYEEMAYQLLLQEQCPSWLYMVKMGATSIWENWAAIRSDGSPTDSSFNHYALGCVGDWLYRRVAGMEPAAPGYAHIRFAPLFHVPLHSAAISRMTPYGLAASSWVKDGDKVTWDITVPQNATATAALPAGDVRLGSGRHRFELLLD